MNFYFVVEGRQTERQVYQSWLSAAFPKMTRVHALEHLDLDNYFLVVGHGYPSYIRRLEAAVADFGTFPGLDVLFVCIDAEDVPYEQKRAEITSILDQHGMTKPAHVFVQNSGLQAPVPQAAGRRRGAATLQPAAGCGFLGMQSGS